MLRKPHLGTGYTFGGTGEELNCKLRLLSVLRPCLFPSARAIPSRPKLDVSESSVVACRVLFFLSAEHRAERSCHRSARC